MMRVSAVASQCLLLLALSSGPALPACAEDTATVPLLAVASGTDGVTAGADLAGSEWLPNFMSESDLPAGNHISVEFKPGGEISGNGGCNRFFGGYTIAGNTIKIGPIASTRKGCPGILRLETAFFATLEAAKTFQRDGSTLVLFGAGGIKLAQFDQADAD
jgi:heat shock protein HslJ